MSSSSNTVTHSEPIPINNASNHTRPRSLSESSTSDSVPPLSPSQSPSSLPNVNVQTPFSSASRIPVTPVSPSSPILSYFYGSPTKSPFSRVNTYSKVFEDEESQEPPPTPASPPGRRMSSSWIPVKFGTQQQAPPPTELQQERGAGIMRRLSLSAGPKPPVFNPGRSPTPPNAQGANTQSDPKLNTRGFGRHRKAATLSAPTVDSNNKRRAPSPMGERMLKGQYDGF